MNPVSSSRQVRLFKNGKNQAVRIPREFELPGEEAILTREESGRLILEPIPQKDLMSLLASWEPLQEEDCLPQIEDLPAEPVEL